MGKAGKKKEKKHKSPLVHGKIEGGMGEDGRACQYLKRSKSRQRMYLWLNGWMTLAPPSQLFPPWGLQGSGTTVFPYGKSLPHRVSADGILACGWLATWEVPTATSM
jgi:hypothetical protein